MREIPEDVMRAASKWTAQCYLPETGTWLDVRDVIARAILAERRRCAGIARSVEGDAESSEAAGSAHRIASSIEATPCA